MVRNKSGTFGQQPGQGAKTRIAQNVPKTFGKIPEDMKTSRINYGARVLGLQQGPDRSQNSLDQFLASWVSSGTTSLSEAMVYWALLKIVGPEGQGWKYQDSVMGGRHGPGGAVVDFVVYYRSVAYAIRLQTYRYHIAAGPEKQAYDQDQIVNLSTLNVIVVDIYEQDFIDDTSGQAVLQVVYRAINGQYSMSPIASGIAQGIS